MVCPAQVEGGIDDVSSITCITLPRLPERKKGSMRLPPAPSPASRGRVGEGVTLARQDAVSWRDAS